MNDDRTAGSEPEGPREPKVIKRYTNRKLYDTVESRYVTLDEIGEMIKAGAEVQIIDNRTKEDLTSVTLAQIIFEEEKKTSKMSLETLRDLIRHGGEVAQRLVEGTQAELRGRVEAVRAAAEQRVQSIITRSQATSDRAKEMVQTSQEALAAFQRKVDDRVRSAVEGMTSLSEAREQLDRISERIAKLEQRLDDLTKDDAKKDRG
jgi:polyhydroxyalkanoate synthesis repressor PhaR